MFAASKDDVAGRMCDAGDHGVGSAVLDHFAGGGEVGRRDGGDLGPGMKEMLERSVRLLKLVMGRNRCLDRGVVEFGEGDFEHKCFYYSMLWR